MAERPHARRTGGRVTSPAVPGRVRAMSEAGTFSPGVVIEVAERLGITREALEGQLRLADSEGEVDAEPMLNAMRALLTILERAEAAK